jgi:hypothetical protein
VRVRSVTTILARLVVRNLRIRNFLTVYMDCYLCRPHARYVDVGF